MTSRLATRVLLVEDDQMVAAWANRVLSEAGYGVDVADTGTDGYRLGLGGEYDLALIDLELPDRHGLTLVHALRTAGRTLPIVIMTARADDADIVVALDAGADDYLVKPVPNGVLTARVRAALRRGGARRADSLAVGDLMVDRLARRVSVRGRALELTPREYALLECFALHPGQVLPRSDLLSRVWGVHFDPGTNVVDAAMSRLRRRLQGAGSAARVRAVRGIGYALAMRAPAGRS